MKSKNIEEILSIVDNKEKTLQSFQGIFINGKREFQIENLKDFILSIFKNNPWIRTCFIATGKPHATYSTRSVFDIYRVCYTINNNIKFYQVILAMFTLLKEGKLGSHICYTALRRMYVYTKRNAVNDVSRLREYKSGDGMRLTLEDYQKLEDYYNKK